MRLDIKLALDDYVKEGVPTGGFMRAVLANDLMESIARADEYNKLDLFKICQYVHWEIPANCHGSYEVVDAWIERKKEEVKVFKYLEAESEKDSKL